MYPHQYLTTPIMTLIFHLLISFS